MVDETQPPAAPSEKPVRSKLPARLGCTAAFVLAAAGAALAGTWLADVYKAPSVSITEAAVSAPAETVAKVELTPIEQDALDLLRTALKDAAEPAKLAWSHAEGVEPVAVEEPASPAILGTQLVANAGSQVVPLPVARPPEFRGLADAITRADRRARRTQTVAVAPTQTEDDRNFFEKFFGVEKAAAPAMAYAALETPGTKTPLPQQRLSPSPTPPAAQAPAPAAGGGTAVYDISARIVTLPNGEKLEAHSGLGPHMDDPKNVHLRMRGATPPATYDLTERGELFHGVRALRLNPVGGAEGIHGRAGLLAHTYMLGPSGQSNGCVSFRDYNRFLQAYLRGEITRLVVVSGKGQDLLPNFAEKLFGKPTRTANAANDG